MSNSDWYTSFLVELKRLYPEAVRCRIITAEAKIQPQKSLSVFCIEKMSLVGRFFSHHIPIHLDHNQRICTLGLFKVVVHMVSASTQKNPAIVKLTTCSPST